MVALPLLFLEESGGVLILSSSLVLQCYRISGSAFIIPLALTAGVLEKCSEREGGREGGPDAAVGPSQASQIDLVCVIGPQQ